MNNGVFIEWAWNLSFTIFIWLSAQISPGESVNPIFPFPLFICVNPPILRCSHIYPSPALFILIIHFSFSKWHLTLVTTYFSQTTLVVSQPNKQCCRMWQAMSPSFTSNPVRFCLQSPRVLSAKPTSIASVAREPYKCRSWAVQVSLMSHASITHAYRIATYFLPVSRKSLCSSASPFSSSPGCIKPPSIYTYC